ncbi:MAG: HAMP domain-containing histidine kinase [Candidatus Competibacteraceae bacterium]|nr:HAMP domain-containing histidine kinase [Candidatus Competibacteraceae bacterium]
MRSKILIPLLLIVLLPLLLLSLAAWRLVQSERAALAHQVQSLVAAQLQSVDDSLQSYFQRKQQQLDSDLAGLADLLSQSATSAIEPVLDRYNREQPGVRQLFLLNAQNERLYPPAQLNPQEQRFMTRSAAFWDNLSALRQNQSAPAPVDPPSSLLSRATAISKTGPADDLIHSQGWYIWQWGAQTHLIYWRWDQQQRVWGIELDPSYLLAELIAVLPATSADANAAMAARLQLYDANGTVLYQWGDYQPAEQQRPLLLRPLSHPLGSWSLSYFAPALTLGRSQLWLISLAAISAVGLALGLLAWFLYREHQRELRLAQQRVNFVNQVSHELKTPLTNIRMYAELLEDRLDTVLENEPHTGGVGTPQRYLAVIVSESQRLSRLINNVLSFAGWQKNRLALRPRPAVVDEVIGTAVETFRPLLAAKQIGLDLHLQAPQPISLDPDVLEQILNNLLGNVEKYVAAGDQVTLASWQHGEQSFIRLQDDGPGIPARERQRIFEPFYRLGSALTEGVSGAGLGLTISRELARLHGGDLELEPTSTGACFLLRISTPPETSS